MIDDDGVLLKTFILGLGITGVSALAILALPSLPFAIPTFFSTVLLVSGAIGVILAALSALVAFAYITLSSNRTIIKFVDLGTLKVTNNSKKKRTYRIISI